MNHQKWWEENQNNVSWRAQGPVILTKEAWKMGAKEEREKFLKLLSQVPTIEIKACCIDPSNVSAVIRHAAQWLRGQLLKEEE